LGFIFKEGFLIFENKDGLEIFGFFDGESVCFSVRGMFFGFRFFKEMRLLNGFFFF